MRGAQAPGIYDYRRIHYSNDYIYYTHTHTHTHTHTQFLFWSHLFSPCTEIGDRTAYILAGSGATPPPHLSVNRLFSLKYERNSSYWNYIASAYLRLWLNTPASESLDGYFIFSARVRSYRNRERSSESWHLPAIVWKKKLIYVPGFTGALLGNIRVLPPSLHYSSIAGQGYPSIKKKGWKITLFWLRGAQVYSCNRYPLRGLRDWANTLSEEPFASPVSFR